MRTGETQSKCTKIEGESAMVATHGKAPRRTREDVIQNVGTQQGYACSTPDRFRVDVGGLLLVGPGPRDAALAGRWDDQGLRGEPFTQRRTCVSGLTCAVEGHADMMTAGSRQKAGRGKQAACRMLQASGSRQQAISPRHQAAGISRQATGSGREPADFMLEHQAADSDHKQQAVFGRASWGQRTSISA